VVKIIREKITSYKLDINSDKAKLYVLDMFLIVQRVSCVT